MLSTFRPEATQEYQETEQAYYTECGQHYEQGKAHADFNAPANIGRLYRYYNMRLRNLLYSQFERAANFNDYDALNTLLPPPPHPHLKMIRHMMFNDAAKAAHGFLPIMPSGHDPFSPSHYEIESRPLDAKLSDGSSTHALGILATNSENAAVCFTHRPGFPGMSPTNAAEDLIEQTRDKYLQSYRSDQLRFFTHVPWEAGGKREHLFEVKIVDAEATFRPISHKPRFFDMAVFNALALPESMEAEVKNIAESEEEINWHRINALQETHMAQVHRRYLVATL